MSSIFNLALPPLSLVYRAVTQTRLAAYKKGLLRVNKLDVPVISVGNITTGGTGKTPLVEWVCRVLARDKRKICILTRGYGRVNHRARVVVSDGSRVLAHAEEAGDEPFLLAQELKGIAAVISDRDRVAAGTWAMENLGAEVFVLDDGFQQLRLARDLNIVAIDATNPWGGGRLLPYGRLREPRSGLARADCVVITRTNQSNDLAALSEELRPLVANPAFMSQMNLRAITVLTSRRQADVASLAQPVAAFCAIGNPRFFFDQLERSGFNLVLTQTFPDHHGYNQSDVDNLIQQSRRVGARSLITTAKDAVKLTLRRFELPCYVLEIEISIEGEENLIQMINAAVSE